MDKRTKRDADDNCRADSWSLFGRFQVEQLCGAVVKIHTGAAIAVVSTGPYAYVRTDLRGAAVLHRHPLLLALVRPRRRAVC